MSSSYLINGGGRTYRLDLEIITKSSSLSSPSSTLSESNNYSPFFISTKRARSPRKRPNQSSAEASALLSTISPKLFSPAMLRRKNYLPVRLSSCPIPDEATLLLCESHSVEKLPISLEPKVEDSSVCSLPYFQFQDPGSPEFDAESILGDEVEEGIDSIIGMGNLSMSSNSIKDCNFDCLGFGFGISSNIMGALRQKDKGEWWWADVVNVKDIVPKLKETPVKTKKKKKEKEEGKDIADGSSAEVGILEPRLRLWLKLDYDEVIKEWPSGSPFSTSLSGETRRVSVESATDVIARLATIDLFPDVGGGASREESVYRHKEKQRTSLFSKKIGYQVRKLNGDQRPRMKIYKDPFPAPGNNARRKPVKP
ncbi:protein CHLOROPLAST IMPORT APPARATUS 2 isoform X1 [Dendrobium catenatum]|uniref:protein CHLOROPLAST IMPORT APPARATUS 2 isoform X1 n=1 Tax=Dendrobium catenatum TaxID=906689 RepID=UPI0009F66033|nr:protein CHLOROPLAST IMPORT APPARATUS 2 isoform X1 [Dendrobium catenatum]XP_020697119.1 protein CHLOROPLAST IMPORT APPARATUS 2 isoform X1 [Dendrobium catenatum]